MKKTKDYHIGYVCGVFDMFHVGHLNLLNKAKTFCDILIVGVNSDELTETYKGKRPIINQDDRMAVVRGIESVDEVVLVDYHNDSSMLAWSLYHFDVQFCGDDHEDELQEVKVKLQERGSDLVFFPYTEGISSTMIRNKLK